MTEALTVRAPAKLNLTLDVLGRREDGYHELRMVMQSVALADEVTLAPGGGEGVRVESNFGFLPTDGRNLAAAAALAFRRQTGRESGPLDIRLTKRIPVCAGLGGGSSDAGAVLRALNELTGAGLSTEELCRIGQSVGADVPYCVLGGTALAEGIGERLTPLPPLPACPAVICKPEFSVSTPELFRAADAVALRRRPDTEGVLRALEAGDLAGVARRMYNVFEDVLPERSARRVEQIKKTLIACGALGACMSGTGSAVFGLFADRSQAAGAAETLRAESEGEVFLTETV